MRRRAALLSVLSLTASGRAWGSEPELITLERPRLDLPAGRSLLAVELPATSFATVGVFGPTHALLGLTVSGDGAARALRRSAPLDEDGLLPRTLSVRTGDASERLELIVEVTDPVRVELVAGSLDQDIEPSAKGLKTGAEPARPLVGLPVPNSPKDGYMLASAARYVFVRIDVARSLISAFERTRKRFSSDPICVSDASQWNGKRPKTDLGEARHISHEGGCDVDLGIPANDTYPSSVREHCRGVRLEVDRFGCAPGTAKGVDFERLAYFLGTLADEAPGRIVKVFLDDVYRREVVRVAPGLHERGFIKDAGLLALAEDGVLVASPWHTDHVHVRFAGEPARTLFSP